MPLPRFQLLSEGKPNVSIILPLLTLNMLSSRINPDRSRSSVSNAYKDNPTLLCGIKRGVTNEPRNVTIFLARRLRCDFLKAIGKEFNISNYSSVSTIIERMKTNLRRNKNLKQHYNKIITEIS